MLWSVEYYQNALCLLKQVKVENLWVDNQIRYKNKITKKKYYKTFSILNTLIMQILNQCVVIFIDG